MKLGSIGWAVAGLVVFAAAAAVLFLLSNADHSPAVKVQDVKPSVATAPIADTINRAETRAVYPDTQIWDRYATSEPVPVTKLPGPFVPRPIPDENAASLYAALSGRKLSQADSALVAKYSETAEYCWISQSYARIASVIGPDVDPAAHAQAGRIAVEEASKASALCGGFPADGYVKNDEWIAELASLGDPTAMLFYATQTMWTRDIETAMRDPQRLMTYRSNTLSYLDRLIDMGNAEAMIMMGAIELNPTWHEPRPEMAWAYMYGAAVAQKKHDFQTNLLLTFDSRVAREKQAAAREFADKLIQRCCTK